MRSLISSVSNTVERNEFGSDISGEFSGEHGRDCGADDVGALGYGEEAVRRLEEEGMLEAFLKVMIEALIRVMLATLTVVILLPAIIGGVLCVVGLLFWGWFR